MAYTNAVFRVDLVNGSDAARTGFTPSAYANNGSGAVRVTYTAHGLITGAVVDITGTTSSVYVGAWKITKIDNDNFDLDTSTYTVNPATKGTVTPRGGSSWTDAWLTLNNGATASRIAAGDTIRVAKTGAPTSIGNATWTLNSNTVTLASAKTITVDNCETAWTSANSANVTRQTGSKEGTYYARVVSPASTTVSTKYAYYTLPSTLDLSAYQDLNLWFIANTSSYNTNTRWSIKLCSDTTGDTVVDSFEIPAIPLTGQWTPMVITKTGGGNLGNSIKSIAIYTGTVTPGNSQNVQFDNIFVSKTNDLNLQSLISKNSAETGGTETWHGIQSIDGTTIKLANDNGTTNQSAQLRGYYGTTETVTTYMRTTFKFAQQSSITSAQTIQKGGSAGNQITFTGGWNTTNDTQDGDTWIDGVNGYGCGILAQFSYLTFERINVCRFYYGYNQQSDTTQYTTRNFSGIAICCNSGYYSMDNQATINILSNNNYNGYTVSNASAFNTINIISKNDYTGGLTNQNSSQFINNLEIYNGFYNSLNLSNAGGEIYINNLTIKYPGAAVLISNATINNLIIENNSSSISMSFVNTTVNKLTASNNTYLGAGLNFRVKQLNSSNLIGTSTQSGIFPRAQPSVFLGNVNNVATDHRAYWSYGNVLSQTTTRHTASGVAWQLNITNTGQNSNYPVYYPIARVACNANTAVTVKAWVKKSHATDIAAQIAIKAYEIAGVNAEVSTTKASDTNWEELTITFTPTVAGVAEINLKAWWVANAASQSVYVDDITVSQ